MTSQDNIETSNIPNDNGFTNESDILVLNESFVYPSVTKFELDFLTSLSKLPSMTVSEARDLARYLCASVSPGQTQRRFAALIKRNLVSVEQDIITITPIGLAAVRSGAHTDFNAKTVTPRDQAVLDALSKCACLTTAQVISIAFREAPWYAYKRLKVLEKRGYVTRKGSKVFIAQKGLEKAGYKDISSRPTRRTNRSATAAGDIFIALSRVGWEFVSSKIVKQDLRLDRGGIFSGFIFGSKKQAYPVYLLNRYARKDFIKKVRDEMEKLPGRTSVSGAVVVCAGEDAVRAFGTSQIKQLARLMVLRQDLACSVLERFALESGFIPLYESALPGHSFHPSSKSFSDYVVRDGRGVECYTFELFTNDLNARHSAAAYLKRQYKVESRRFIVFAFESQLPLVSKYFSGDGCQAVYAVTEDWTNIRQVRTLPVPEPDIEPDVENRSNRKAGFGSKKIMQGSFDFDSL